MRTKKIETMVEVELSLDDFTDEEIREEYAERGLVTNETLADVKDAFCRGDEKAAISLVKKIVCDEFGVVL
jgi:hypothetical protein